jgi:hypothetical protein
MVMKILTEGAGLFLLTLVAMVVFSLFVHLM